MQSIDSQPNDGCNDSFVCRILSQEVDNIKRCQEDMKRLVQKANAQLALVPFVTNELRRQHTCENLRHFVNYPAEQHNISSNVPACFTS